METIKIKEGEVYLVKGEFRFKVGKGKIEAVGKILTDKDDEQFIPVGKSIPVEGIEDAEILIQEKYKENLVQLDKRTIPETWDKLLNRILEEDVKSIIILGEMDTGKSFFTTYIANKLISNNKRVGVIDSDIGQSDLGPPGTIALSILPQQYLFLSRAPITTMEFIGAHSPGLHMVTTIVAFHKITNRAKKECDIVIVNTNGWVHGDGARTLKNAKIDILDPDLIILMQREDEIEHLIKYVFPQTKVVRMHVSKRASDTSKKDREKLRNLSSQQYFENSTIIEIKFNDFVTERVYFRTGKELPEYKNDNIVYFEKFPSFEGCLIVSKNKLTDKEIEKFKSKGFFNIKNVTEKFSTGILVSLLSEKKETLALGIIKKIDYENKKIILVTPYNGEKENIKIIQFGSLRYTFDGKEAGFVEPGSF